MNSYDFFNYINNSKNLILSYNGDWNKIFRERGIKNKLEKTSTFKSNNSNKRDSKEEINNNINDKKEIKDNNKINEENVIIFNNNKEDFLLEKNNEKNNEIKNEENLKKENDKVKTQLPFENKNNGFKEKIDEIYKQKKQNDNNSSIVQNIIINNNNTKDKKFQKINNNIMNRNIKNAKIKPIKLDGINKKNYTPSISKDREQSSNNNIYINTISFSNNSNKNNLTIHQPNCLNSKNELDSYKTKSAGKLKMRKNKTTKSEGKYNKIKKKVILININKIRIENRNTKKQIKNEKIKTMTNNMGPHPINNKKKNFNKCRGVKINNSSKFIFYKNDKIKKENSHNFTNKYINLSANNNSIFKSANKNKNKMDINKNYKNIGNKKIRFTPSLTINNNNKVSYNQNTNLSKKISIESIYYAHKKNLKEINNLYNKISLQTKYKKSDSTIK
jgi:hypothetical protein